VWFVINQVLVDGSKAAMDEISRQCFFCGHDSLVNDVCSECGQAQSTLLSSATARYVRRKSHVLLLLCRAIPTIVLICFLCMLASVSLLPAKSIWYEAGGWVLLAGLGVAAISFSGLAFGITTIRPYDHASRRTNMIWTRGLACIASCLLLWGLFLGTQQVNRANSSSPTIYVSGVVAVICATCASLACWFLIIQAAHAKTLIAAAFGVTENTPLPRRPALFFAAATLGCWGIAVADPGRWFPGWLIIWAFLSLYIAIRYTRGWLTPIIEGQPQAGALRTGSPTL
jgi:uncharacterized membrane protein